jgi:hypothetical protein
VNMWRKAKTRANGDPMLLAASVGGMNEESAETMEMYHRRHIVNKIMDKKVAETCAANAY